MASEQSDTSASKVLEAAGTKVLRVRAGTKKHNALSVWCEAGTMIWPRAENFGRRAMATGLQLVHQQVLEYESLLSPGQHHV